MNYDSLLVFAILLLGTPSHTQCHNINDTYRLLKDKLANYDRTIRPTMNQSEPTIVKFSFYLTFLQDLDEVNQKVSMIAILGLYWTDEMMKWDPTHYGNMTHFLTESGRFWTPNLILVNNAENIDRVGDEWQSIRYLADGSATYFPAELFSASCNVDITFYPWDRHACVLQFVPQNYLPSEVEIRSITNKVDIDKFPPNGAWKCVDSFIQSVTLTHYSIIDVYLIFERKPRFVIVNVIFPIVFMAFLSVGVFLIPPDSGERISYTITMLLAISVFLTLVGDNLPKIANPMPVFSYYLLAMLSANICITMLTIFNLRLYHTDTRVPVSGCWTRMATCFKTKKEQTVLKPPFSGSFENPSDTKFHVESDSRSVYVTDEVTKSDAFGHINRQRLYHKIPAPVTAAARQKQHELSAKTISTNDTDCQNMHKDNADEITWQDISAVIDKICFFIFCIIITVATAIYFVTILKGEGFTIQDVLISRI